jgi:hypothetical protein
MRIFSSKLNIFLIVKQFSPDLSGKKARRLKKSCANFMRVLLETAAAAIRENVPVWKNHHGP